MLSDLEKLHAEAHKEIEERLKDLERRIERLERFREILIDEGIAGLLKIVKETT